MVRQGQKIHSEQYKNRLKVEYMSSGNPCWRGGKVKSYCLVCGKELWSFPSQVKKYCSRTCLGKANGGRIKGKRPRPWNIFTCQWCGKTFERIPSVKNARFCSKQCFGSYKLSVLNADPELSRRRLKALQKKPTKPEARIINILNEFSIRDWEYVGDGQVKLAGLYPDFINVNGKKKLIEVFGRGYHDPAKPYLKRELELYRQEPYRKAIYASLGFDCLVLWDDEMEKFSDEEIADRIKTFTKSRHKPTAQLALK